MNELMKVNEYVPTAAEVRLLEVLSNPNMAGKSVTDKCKAAECSTPVYYAALKKPGFVALVKDTAVELVKGKALDVVASTLKFATKDSRCHSDRKMLLQMAGIVEKESDTRLTLIQNTFQLPELKEQLRLIEEELAKLEEKEAIEVEVIE